MRMHKSYAFILEGNVASEFGNCNHGIAPLIQQFPNVTGYCTSAARMECLGFSFRAYFVKLPGVSSEDLWHLKSQFRAF